MLHSRVQTARLYRIQSLNIGSYDLSFEANLFIKEGFTSMRYISPGPPEFPYPLANVDKQFLENNWV